MKKLFSGFLLIIIAAFFIYLLTLSTQNQIYLIAGSTVFAIFGVLLIYLYFKTKPSQIKNNSTLVNDTSASTISPTIIENNANIKPTKVSDVVKYIDNINVPQYEHEEYIYEDKGMDFVAIDFETANSNRTSICSMGLAFVENGRIVNDMEYLIKPYPFEFNPYNVKVHGITENDVKNALCFHEVWEHIYPLLQDKVLVAHNASFDMSVLRQTLEHYKVKVPGFDFFCTYQLSKKAFPTLASHRLDVVSTYCNISFNHHNARSDARACAEILCNVFNNSNCCSFDDIENNYNLVRGYFDDLEYFPCSSFSSCYIKPSNEVTNPLYMPQPEVSASRANKYKSIKELKNISDFCIDDDFNGKYFCFTGTLLSMTRSKAWEIVATGGGIAQDGINKNTNVLVVGLQDYSRLNGTLSSKMKKAYELKEKGQDIQIVAENDFLAMIDDELYKKCGIAALATV